MLVWNTLHVFEGVGILLCILIIHWHTLVVAGHLPFQVVVATLTPANVCTLWTVWDICITAVWTGWVQNFCMANVVTTVSGTPIKFAYKASFVEEMAEEFCVQDKKINHNHVITKFIFLWILRTFKFIPQCWYYTDKCIYVNIHTYVYIALHWLT